MVKESYECEICHKDHHSHSRAESCEKKGRPRLVYKNGQNFQYPGDSRTIQIIDHKVVLSWGKHINKYKVKWWRRTVWLSEKTIVRYVASKSWVLV